MPKFDTKYEANCKQCLGNVLFGHGTVARMGIFAAGGIAAIQGFLWVEKCGCYVLHEFGTAAIVHGADDTIGYFECARRMQ